MSLDHFHSGSISTSGHSKESSHLKAGLPSWSFGVLVSVYHLSGVTEPDHAEEGLLYIMEAGRTVSASPDTGAHAQCGL